MTKNYVASESGRERVKATTLQDPPENWCCLQYMFKIIFLLSWGSPWDNAISTITED